MSSSSTPNGADLKRVETLSISPELFEKLYLSPQNNVHGDLRKTFGSPTPLAIIGFVVALSPASCILMGWRGAKANKLTHSGANYWFGGFLLLFSGFLEFFLGNTFPAVVFMSYGANFFVFAPTFHPFYAAISSYSGDGSQTPTETPQFASSFAFYLLFMGVLTFIYLICSLRTNLVFVLVFLSAMLGFILAAASFWTTALGEAVGATLLKGSGGSFFVACIAGWYLLCAIMFATLDLPWGLSGLPVGDLSTWIKGASEKRKA
ncbi:GPR1/FUN34/YaaH-class plasma membrane protein [Cadophora sp. DSE1049]|nr:GPR1/FUN34/YaaH-class plasma membrane protein [Cadophora sp. DSE1049]